MTKYVTPYSKFLLEQDAALGVPVDAAVPAPPKKEENYDFIFLDEKHGLVKKKYPDGTVSMDFPVFSLTDSELEDWVKKNVLSGEKHKMTDSELEQRRESIKKIVKGDRTNISNHDVTFLEKLKNAVNSDIFGSRRPQVSIIFTKEGEPTTTEVNVTFIKFNS